MFVMNKLPRKLKFLGGITNGFLGFTLTRYMTKEVLLKVRTIISPKLAFRIELDSSKFKMVS